MGRRRQQKKAILTMDRLEFKGISGLTENGQRWMAKGACVGDRVEVHTKRKGKAVLLDILEASSDRVSPSCPHFLTCGGCQLQHTPPAIQRALKEDMIHRLFEDFQGTIHPLRAADDALHYRNKMELSFGTRRFYADPEAAKAAAPGSFLGMHPWQWHSKIVPLTQCDLAHPSIDAAIRLLAENAPTPAWNTYDQTGVWRHVVLRHGGGLLVNLITSSAASREEVLAISKRLETLPDLRGVLWTINDGLAEVATGTVQEILFGVDTLEITFGGKVLEIPHNGFAQVNDKGAEILLDCIREACTDSKKLLDLYCGSGSIGIALSDHFEEVIGIEIQPDAIERAQRNAARNNVSGRWIAGKVEETLSEAQAGLGSTILLDPPREGLHPKACQFFANQEADSLVYVACNPKSLARDRITLEAGNWTMTDLWMVDMFPQTPHVECVGKFIFSPTED